MNPFFSIEKMPRISIIAGHYGSGKTNTAVNIALYERKAGFRTAIADIDIVNPYFRTADFEDVFTQKGIELIAPMFANSNLDIPSLGADVDRLFSNDDLHSVIDVGGDDAGAVALGRYAKKLYNIPDYGMYYVANCNRYLEENSDDALAFMREIESASRLRFNGIINSTNLCKETTADTILDSVPFIEELSKKSGLPVLFHCARRDIADEVAERMTSQIAPVLPVDIFVLPPWEK